MNHSTSKRTAKAMPQVESTVFIEGIDKKLIKCTARKDFTVGNSSVKEGETFFLVRSERRENRFYVVHFNEARATYQCSCGASTCEHEHVRTVREHVMSTVVVPAAAESSEVTPMTVPATSAQVRKARKATKVEQTSEQFDGSRQITAAEWKAIQKADRKRQQAWQDEYRQQVAAS
jgi:REP element-mobilizing transposase RayT